MKQQEYARPMKQIWVNYSDKNAHHGKLWEREQPLTHISSQIVGITHLALDIGDLDYTELCPPEKWSGDTHHREGHKKKATHGVVSIILSLPSSLSLTHLLFDKSHTTDFGIWSYLHLNSDKGIFNNLTVILFQKREHRSCF